MDTNWMLDEMEVMFPNAECELLHKNDFELLIAVILSAQTTDESVNKVTPALFEAFPNAKAMGEADLKEIEKKIRKIGLYRNKAQNIKACASILDDKYDGKVPESFKVLTSLPGVGRKTANVVRSVWFDIPSVAVDTHVERVSKRLGLAKFGDSVEVVEQKLKRKIERNRWNHAHHLFIFFGRYHCMARNPQCEGCVFLDVCKKDKYEAYKQKMKTKTP